MQELINNFHFLRPWWLLALLVPIVGYWKYMRGMKNKSSWENVCDKKLLAFLLIKGSASQRKTLSWLVIGGLIGGILAIAGPTWHKKEIPGMQPENPIMILLNLSSDMQKKDLTPSRLERAKYKIIDLLEMMPTAQSGLIVYSDEPFLITPISEDNKIVENLLPAVDYKIMPTNGDRLDRAILLATDKLQKAGYFNANIIIFSADIGQRFDLALSAAQKAMQLKYNISTINMSAENNDKLALLAEKGNGIYVKASNNDRDIQKIANFIISTIKQLKMSKNKQSAYLDYGYYLTMIPLLCCLYFFRRGIWVIVLGFVWVNNAQANMFLNQNQQAYEAFAQGDYTTAKNKFKNSEWKASALYKNGEYEQAFKLFAQKNDSESLYNQANSLAKAGKIKEAIKKYEEVIKIDPEHEDAKFNLEYLKQQEKTQKQNQQKSEQNKENQKNNSEAKEQESEDNAENDKQSHAQNQTEDQNDKSQKSKNDAGSGDSRNQQDKEQQGNEQSQSGEKQQEATSEKKQGTSQNLGQEGNEEQNSLGMSEQGQQEDKEEQQNNQARIQKLRDIPEDPGGLLKAFIAKEYRRNRYGDEE